MALFYYQQELQQLLGDQLAQRFNIADITRYINRARRKIAGATQCIRVLPPSSGSFATLTVGTGGSGYTSPPTVTISAPDALGTGFTQATATCTISGGAVNGFTLTNVGTGYVNPTVTLSGGGGTNATASFTLTSFVKVVPGQEVYTFASVDPIVAANFPGVGNIIAVQSAAVSWGSWKPTMRQMGWSSFQAYCRAWNVGQENYPTVWSQYGQGEAGSIYIFPIPAITAQMDLDCFCHPIDLASDSDVEAIPRPFTEAIPFYAAYLAYLSIQNADMAENMWQIYRRQMAEARTFASPPVVPDFYPSGL